MGTPARRSRPRRRPSRASRWPLAAGIGGGALALIAVFWLLSRRGSGDGDAPRPAQHTPGQAPAASTNRDVTLVSVPASYSDAAVGRLAAQLRSPDLRTRVAAANALAGLGPSAREATSALLNALARRNSEIEFERAVSKAMKAIGPAAVPQLVEVLRGGGAQARFHAAAALSRLGPDAAGALSALIEALESDPDMSVRSSAAVALGAIGPPAEAALPALRRAVGNPNERLTHDAARAELRVRAQMAIGQIKSRAKD